MSVAVGDQRQADFNSLMPNAQETQMYARKCSPCGDIATLNKAALVYGGKQPASFTSKGSSPYNITQDAFFNPEQVFDYTDIDNLDELIVKNETRSEFQNETRSATPLKTLGRTPGSDYDTRKAMAQPRDIMSTMTKAVISQIKNSTDEFILNGQERRVKRSQSAASNEKGVEMRTEAERKKLAGAITRSASAIGQNFSQIGVSGIKMANATKNAKIMAADKKIVDNGDGTSSERLLTKYEKDVNLEQVKLNTIKTDSIASMIEGSTNIVKNSVDIGAAVLEHDASMLGIQAGSEDTAKESAKDIANTLQQELNRNLQRIKEILDTLNQTYKQRCDSNMSVIKNI